jgi:hypothetical protein
MRDVIQFLQGLGWKKTGVEKGLSDTQWSTFKHTGVPGYGVRIYTNYPAAKGPSDFVVFVFEEKDTNKNIPVAKLTNPSVEDMQVMMGPFDPSKFKSKTSTSSDQWAVGKFKVMVHNEETKYFEVVGFFDIESEAKEAANRAAAAYIEKQASDPSEFHELMVSTDTYVVPVIPDRATVQEVKQYFTSLGWDPGDAYEANGEYGDGWFPPGSQYDFIGVTYLPDGTIGHAADALHLNKSYSIPPTMAAIKAAAKSWDADVEP